MKAMTDKAADRSNAYAGLETIPMSADERAHAYASLRNGERIADLVLRAAADMRAVGQFAERAAASLAGAFKAMLAKPVKH